MKADDLGKLVLRVTLGVLLLLHGVAKLTNGIAGITGMVARAGFPEAFGYLVYVGEIVAPLLLIAGIWTRPAALVVVVNMAVAIGLAHPRDIFALNKMGAWAIELQGFFLFTAVAIALLGAGRFSVGGVNGRWN